MRLLRLAMKAKDLPEVAIVVRVVLGIAGLSVLVPVVSALRDPSALAPTDYVGLPVFCAVGGWLVWTAIRGPRADDE